MKTLETYHLLGLHHLVAVEVGHLSPLQIKITCFNCLDLHYTIYLLTNVGLPGAMDQD